MAKYPKLKQPTIKWQETKLPRIATWVAENPTTNRSAIITRTDILHQRNKYKIQVFEGNKLLFSEFCGSSETAKKRGKYYLINTQIT
jgi:co-chaperonin GroES (HSP10)